jgi:hypothetical protein
MKREINTHKVNGANEAISIEAMDERGAGNANHKYRLQVRSHGPERKPDGPLHSELLIQFQNGPINEGGPNGVTNEALLAVVVDRLEGFQAGPFKCKENEDALAMIKGGLTCLLKRTQRRLAAGTEGTHKPDAPEQVDTAAAPAAAAQG